MLKVYFPELALGIKTIFFTIIGPLINPAGAPHHLMGVYQPHLVDLVGDAVTQLDMNHVVVAHGIDGLDEISILGPTAHRRGQGRPGRAVRDHAGGLRLPAGELRGRQGRRPRLQRARRSASIFEGRDTGPRRDFLVLNNGFALYVAGAAASPEEGLAKAQENDRLRTGDSRSWSEFADGVAHSRA